MKQKEIKISDMLNTALFCRKLTDEMDMQIELQRKARHKFGKLKRSPIDRLRERGVWNLQMVDLYSQVLNGTLKGYSRAERDYIRALGDRAFRKALDLQKEIEKENEEQKDEGQ